MEEKQKKELKELIEDKAYNFFDDMMNAKEALDTLAKGVQDTYSIKAADFKKMVKLFYEDKKEVEKNKFLEFFSLYEEITK